MEVNMNEEGKQEEKKEEKPKKERKKVPTLEEILTTKNALFSLYKATKGMKVENNYEMSCLSTLISSFGKWKQSVHPQYKTDYMLFKLTKAGAKKNVRAYMSKLRDHHIGRLTEEELTGIKKEDIIDTMQDFTISNLELTEGNKRKSEAPQNEETQRPKIEETIDEDMLMELNNEFDE